MSLLTTQVTAQFGVQSQSGGLVIENDPYSAYNQQIGDVNLLLFPAVPANLVCDIGTVQYRSQKTVTCPGGIVQMSGSNTVSLPKAASGNLELVALNAFDEDGNATTVGLSYDSERNEIRANKKVWAAIKFSSYKAVANEILYRPEIDASQTRLGVVAAFYPPTKAFAIYQVQPFGTDTGNSIFELYRIVSYSVTTPDGEFEKPPNFPSSGAFPGNPIPPLNPQIAMMAQRVHEIAQMDSLGRVFIETYFHPKLSPYQSDAGYTPVRELVKSNVPTNRGFSKELIAKAENEVKRRGQGKL